MIKNPQLQKAEQAVRAKAKDQKGLDRAVNAGLQTMYSPGGAKLFKEQVGKSGDIANNLAEAAVKLLGHIYQQSRNTMPMNVAVPACTILMFNGMDFLEEAGRIKVTPDTIAQATKAMGSFLMQLFGVTPEKLAQIKAGQNQGAAPSGGAPPPAGIVNAAIGGA